MCNKSHIITIIIIIIRFVYLKLTNATNTMNENKTKLTLYKAVACILPLKGTVTETGGGSYIATIDK